VLGRGQGHGEAVHGSIGILRRSGPTVAPWSSQVRRSACHAGRSPAPSPVSTGARCASATASAFNVSAIAAKLIRSPPFGLRCSFDVGDHVRFARPLAIGLATLTTARRPAPAHPGGLPASTQSLRGPRLRPASPPRPRCLVPFASAHECRCDPKDWPGI
jgi:hypothetical protein